TGLSVLGIALGVAVVVSIDVANESARHAFALSSREVAGTATHQILGGPSGLDEAFFVRLRRELGITSAAPLVEGYVASPLEPGRAFRLLGVDPFAEAPFRSYAASSRGIDGRALLTRPGAGLVARATRERIGLAPGGTLPIAIDGIAKEMTLVGDI